jgi:hypothetical protein
MGIYIYMNTYIWIFIHTYINMYEYTNIHTSSLNNSNKTLLNAFNSLHGMINKYSPLLISNFELFKFSWNFPFLLILIHDLDKYWHKFLRYSIDPESDPGTGVDPGFEIIVFFNAYIISITRDISFLLNIPYSPSTSSSW